MKRTPLIEHHRNLNAMLVDFAGWAMPMQYGGVIEQYKEVRTAVGLFDVSHMGRIMLEGWDAVSFLQPRLSIPLSAIMKAASRTTFLSIGWPIGGFLSV